MFCCLGMMSLLRAALLPAAISGVARYVNILTCLYRRSALVLNAVYESERGVRSEMLLRCVFLKFAPAFEIVACKLELDTMISRLVTCMYMRSAIAAVMPVVIVTRFRARCLPRLSKLCPVLLPLLCWTGSWALARPPRTHGTPVEISIKLE